MMRTVTFKILLTAVLLLLPAVIKAQSGLSNGTMGREFWIAIPPNEKIDHITSAIEIYVTSNVNTTVTLSAPGLGIIITKQVQALKITTFNANDGISSNFEIRESEQVTPYGIHITSPDPITVNVLNAKPVTSDGFTALPVSVWGKENVHCSYYDFGEIKPWGGGFIVVASQNQTVINIALKGIGFGRTVGGKKIGEVFLKTLNKGDVYMVRGNGATLGSFDLTGTTVTSSKPIGLISFHERTMIPAIANNNGRDHLSEMIPPTSAWGKKFVSAEYQRFNKGDLFRVVAKENNTNVQCAWYDKKTKQLIGKKQWSLPNAGNFGQSLNASTSPGGEDIRGYSVWESDKPILLMQYSYSANWDGASQFDPFMIVVPPLEQYVQGTVFQTPANVKFNTNWFNILAIGDSADPDQKLLKSIKLDGKFVYQTHPQILLNRIPTTNFYWAPVNMSPGTHRVESETKLAGFMYGFSDFDSYGWPTAMSVNKIDELDTLQPELKIVQECGLFKITATEMRNGNTNDVPRQIESGVSDVMLVKELSTNFKDNPNPISFSNEPMVTRHEFDLEVLDNTKDARAVYEVIDRAGNVVRDTIDYIAEKISLNMQEIDFGKVRVGTTKEFNVVVKNTGTQSILLTNLRVNNPDIFFVTNSQQQQLAPGAEITVTVRYSPKMESTEQFHDRDSLIVSTDCTRFAFAMSGRGVMPKIAVGDFNAGLVKINEKICLENGLWISNPGTDVLTIFEAPSGWTSPFSFTGQAFPVTIAPSDTIFLKDVCFQAGTSGNFVQNITFKSDAMAGDSISEWRGSTTVSGIEDLSENNGLLKISPNPVVNGEIQIEYSVAKSGNAILEIFEPTGKSVKILLKENVDSGSFKKSFSSAELPAGMYYCRLTLNEEMIATQEIVIMK